MKNVNLSLDGDKVLDNINLHINPNSTTVIFGFSGSGKSTLLKSLAGLIRITDGEVLFKNINIGKMDEKAFFLMQSESGFVFQDAALWENRSIYENLALPLRILNPFMDKKDIDNRVRSAINIFNFRENLMIRPSAISAGEKKIISFLRALMTDPEVIFLDEPTISIDKKNISRLNSTIKELKKKKKTIIIVTHDYRLVERIADNLILIMNGAIVKSGVFEEVINSEDENIVKILNDMKEKG